MGSAREGVIAGKRFGTPEVTKAEGDIILRVTSMLDRRLLSLSVIFVFAIPACAQPVPPSAKNIPLPAGVVARLGSPRFKHGGLIKCLAFSPDGKTLATGGTDAVVRLWDAVSGAPIWVSQSLGSVLGRTVVSVDFHPDGETLAATTADNTIYLLDVQRGVVMRHLERWGHGGLGPFFLSPAVFAPDGKTLAASDGAGDDGLVLWDAFTLRRCGKAASVSSVSDLLFSPDGRRLLTLDIAGTVAVWDAGAGKRGAGRRFPSRSPSHRLRRKAKERSAGAADPQPLFTLKTLHDIITGVVFSCDGKQIITTNGTLDLPADFELNHSASFGPWKEVTIRVWDAATGKPMRVLKHDSLRDGILSLALAPDGRTLAVASQKHVHLWDLKKGVPTRALPGVDVAPWSSYWSETIAPLPPPNVLQFSPDGQRLACTAGNVICLWDVATGRLLQPSTEESVSPLTCLALSAKNRLLAIGRAGGQIDLWDFPARRLIRRWKGHGKMLSTLSFAPDTTMLASRSQTGVIRIWDTATGRQLREIKPGKHEGAETAWLAYRSDGKLASDYENRGMFGVHFWDPLRGQVIHTVKASLRGAEELYEVDQSADGGRLQMLTRYGRVFRWQRKDGRFAEPTIQQIQLPSPLLGAFSGSLAFANDGTLAKFDPVGDSIELWGPERHLPIGTRGVPISPHALGFSPSGGYLVLLSYPAVQPLGPRPEENTLRVYEMASRREVLRRRLPAAVGVRCFAFTPDGRYLVTGMVDTTILIWDLFADDGGKSDDLPALWEDLKQGDGGRAHRAVSASIAAGEKGVAFLDGKLQNLPSPKPEELTRWIAELDSEEFAVREQATARLVKAGELARGVLERARAARPSLEMRRRLDALLAPLNDEVPSAETLRRLRSVVILEHIGTTAARRLLRRLSDQAGQVRMSREAKAALKRLEG